IESLKINARGLVADSALTNMDCWIAFYKELARKIVANPLYGITRVLVGTGGATPKKQMGTAAKIAESPKDYAGYSDAWKQMILWENTTSVSQLFFFHPVFFEKLFKPQSLKIKEQIEKNLPLF